jgi:tRNA(His) guanylyltransferase
VTNHTDPKATDSKAKNELLFSQFGINYSHLPARFRKGSTIIRIDPLAVSPDQEKVEAQTQPDKKSKGKRKPYEGTVGELIVLHEDLIREAFWTERPWLLS